MNQPEKDLHCEYNSLIAENPSEQLTMPDVDLVLQKEAHHLAQQLFDNESKGGIDFTNRLLDICQRVRDNSSSVLGMADCHDQLKPLDTYEYVANTTRATTKGKA